MKNKKGFTLIELLAVIVVLAILLVIAIPSILSRLDLVKRKAVVLYANKVYDAASTRYVNDTIKDDVGEIQWYSLSDLKMTDDKYEGYARIDKCSGKNRIYIYVWDDEYKLVSGELKVEDVENIEISPKDEIEATMLTTNTCNNLNSYNITYKYTDGTNTYATSPVSIRNGTKINLPTKVPSNATGLYGNYIITGWKYGTETITDSSIYTYLEDITIDAVLDACGNGYTCESGNRDMVTYNITYSNTCGTVSNPNTYNILSYITLNDPSKTGYTFNGWYEGTASPVTPYIISNQTGDKTIYAKCTANKYNINMILGVGVSSVLFTVDGGSLVINSSDTIGVEYGSTYELTTTCKNGYASPTASINGTMSTAEVNYSASCTPVQYTCGAGTYLPGGSTSCTACPAGYKCSGGTYTFNPSSNQGLTYCAAGTYNSGTGNTSCTTCQAGYYCTGGTSRASCGSGKSSNAGATSSSACYSTSYAASQSQTSYSASTYECNCHTGWSCNDQRYDEGGTWYCAGSYVPYESCSTCYNCPNGGSLSGSRCYTTIYTCPNGGTLNSSTHMCEF